MDGSEHPKRVIAEGYDRMGEGFDGWNAARPTDVRDWFVGEALERLRAGSVILEIGCGPGTDAERLSAGRRYVGVDLSEVQLSIARRRAPTATFVLGDFTAMAFRPGSIDGVVGLYVFNHVPQYEVRPTFARIFEWLHPGGWLLFGLPTVDVEDRVEGWLFDVPMFFAGVIGRSAEDSLTETGFDLEVSEVRDEIEAMYGPVRHRWIIARKPPLNSG